jgi:peptidoglycan/xylan/chitin deacetylase (PgdA/CDA1 family)
MTMNGNVKVSAKGRAGELLDKISAAPVETRPSLVYNLINFLQDWAPAAIDKLIECIGEPDRRLLQQANPLLTWREVVELHRAGVGFGSHTRCHPNLKLLSPKDMEEEIARSKADLESALKVPVDSFAYPGGHRSVEMEQILAKAGYSVAFGTERGFNQADHDVFWLRRINVWDGMLQNHKGRFSPSAFAFNLMMAK